MTKFTLLAVVLSLAACTSMPRHDQIDLAEQVAQVAVELARLKTGARP